MANREREGYRPTREHLRDAERRMKQSIMERELERRAFEQKPIPEPIPQARETYHEPRPQEKPPAEPPQIHEKPKTERNYTYHYEGARSRSGTLGILGRIVFGFLFWALACGVFYVAYLLWTTSPDPWNTVLTWVILIAVGGLVLLYLGGRTLGSILWGA